MATERAKAIAHGLRSLMARVEQRIRGGEKAFVDEHGWPTEFRGLFVGVCPTEQVAVFPGAGRELESEGESTGIEASHDDDGGDPMGLTHPVLLCGPLLKRPSCGIVSSGGGICAAG